MRQLELDATQFVEVLRDPPAKERYSAANDAALVVVDLRDATGQAPFAVSDVNGFVCVLVARTSKRTSAAWSALAQACDVVVDGDVRDERVTVSDVGLGVLRERVLAAPLAATALALLLRGGSTERSIEQDLIAESAVYSLLQTGPEFLAWRSSTEPRTRPDDATPINLHRDNNTLTITLSRPSVHNAFNTAMRDGLTEALQLAVVDNTITRVDLRGAGPSFSSGGDLDEFGTFPDATTAHVIRLARSPARLMALLAARTTVHLHGSCMGAGIELPAFASRVIAAPDTRIALPEIRYGLIPGAGGTVSVPRRIGRHRTAYLALSGAVIDAPTALAWGLVDEIASVDRP